MRSRASRLVQNAGHSFLQPSHSFIHPKTPYRFLQIQAIPSVISSSTGQVAPPHDLALVSTSSSPDARFEILGHSASLLSVSLAASQELFTRRGTLVGVNGSPQNATSTLRILSPFSRAPLRIPFLYQRVTSTTPLGLVISARSPHTSYSIINLDGRLDWKVTRRDALLAWTGPRLMVEPNIPMNLRSAHWGSSTLTGRGLVALAGSGQIYQITLKENEDYVVHPNNVLAYSINTSHPQPFRFKSTAIPIQIPSIGEWLPETKFFRTMRETQTFKASAQALVKLRTWLRTSLWGDRLFLRFNGPTTIVLQSRGARLRDVLTSREVNEIADSPAGSVQAAVASRSTESGEPEANLTSQNPTKETMNYANVGKDGKVSFKS